MNIFVSQLTPQAREIVKGSLMAKSAGSYLMLSMDAFRDLDLGFSRFEVIQRSPYALLLRVRSTA
jgi:hypothetical protein